MRLWKKIVISTFISTLLLPAASLSSWASDDNSDATCIKCGQGTMVVSSVEYSPWEIVGSAPCTHHDPWVLDEVQQRTATTTYVCSNCGFTELLRAEETQVVHHVEEED